MPVLAHAGDWLVRLAYLAPLILLIGALVYGKWTRADRGPVSRPGTFL